MNENETLLQGLRELKKTVEALTQRVDRIDKEITKNNAACLGVAADYKLFKDFLTRLENRVHNLEEPQLPQPVATKPEEIRVPESEFDLSYFKGICQMLPVDQQQRLIKLINQVYEDWMVSDDAAIYISSPGDSFHEVFTSTTTQERITLDAVVNRCFKQLRMVFSSELKRVIVFADATHHDCQSTTS